MPKTIADAKRLMAAKSPSAAEALGTGVFKNCSQARVNNAASIALADHDADFTPDERKLIASFIESEGDDEPRSFMLRVRLTETEQERLQEMAATQHMDMSEYTRWKLFEE
jgi:hypothetical protein